jgi:hypothetical protein
MRILSMLAIILVTWTPTMVRAAGDQKTPRGAERRGRQGRQGQLREGQRRSDLRPGEDHA